MNSEEGAGLECKRYEKIMCPTTRGLKSKSEVIKIAIAKDEPWNKSLERRVIFSERSQLAAKASKAPKALNATDQSSQEVKAFRVAFAWILF